MLGFNMDKLQKIDITFRVEDISDLYNIIYQFTSQSNNVVITKYASDDEIRLWEMVSSIFESLLDELDPRSELAYKNFNKQVKGIFNLRQHSKSYNVLLYPWVKLLQTWYRFFGDKHINNDQPLLYWVDVPQSDRAGNIERLSYNDLYSFICYLGYYKLIDDNRIKEVLQIAEVDIFSSSINPIVNKAEMCYKGSEPDSPVTLTKTPEFNIYSLPNYDEIDSVFKEFCNYDDDEVLKFSSSKLLDIIDLLNIDTINPDWSKGCSWFIVSDIEQFYRLYHRLFKNLIDSNLFTNKIRGVLNDLLITDRNYKNRQITTIVLKISYCLIRLMEGSHLIKNVEAIRDLHIKLKPIILGRVAFDKVSRISANINDLMFFKHIFELFETKYSDIMKISKETLTESSNTNSVKDKYNGQLIEVTCLMNALTEMFEVHRDGTIKVTLREKTSYMDEYAENHRLLKYNDQMNDYEGMKYNLVYHMILIENIEKNVIYNKDIDKDSELYKDAEKARQFAKNDISIYLPKVRSHDSKFNLNTFYKKVKADKVTVTIDGPATASGIKKILKSILLS